jgi:hypothetical protein
MLQENVSEFLSVYNTPNYHIIERFSVTVHVEDIPAQTDTQTDNQTKQLALTLRYGDSFAWAQPTKACV